MFRYTPASLQKLEQLYREADLIIRYEKGSFKSGYCILEDKKVVVINKYFDTESRINSLLDILSQVEIDSQKLSEKSIQLLEQVKEARVKN
ncbi:MAG: hypothetical protein H0V61_07355 [Chitinophagales bacterium]|jgi:hypothetical protein|nr:hypothetical protein [Chitinophagales bacterium]